MPGKRGRGGRGGRAPARGRAGRNAPSQRKAHLYRDHGYPFYGKFLRTAQLQPAANRNSLFITVDESTKAAIKVLQVEAAKRLKILSDLRHFAPVDLDSNYGVHLLSYNNQIKGFGVQGAGLVQHATNCFKASAGDKAELQFEFGHLSCYSDLKNNNLLLLEIQPTSEIQTFLDCFYTKFLAEQHILFPERYTATSLEIVDRPESRTSLITKRLFLPIFTADINSEREGFVVKALRGMKIGTPGSGKLLTPIFCDVVDHDVSPEADIRPPVVLKTKGGQATVPRAVTKHQPAQQNDAHDTRLPITITKKASKGKGSKRQQANQRGGRQPRRQSRSPPRNRSRSQGSGNSAGSGRGGRGSGRGGRRSGRNSPPAPVRPSTPPLNPADFPSL